MRNLRVTPRRLSRSTEPALTARERRFLRLSYCCAQVTRQIHVALAQGADDDSLQPALRRLRGELASFGRYRGSAEAA